MNKHTMLFSLVLISSLVTSLMAEEQVKPNHTALQKIGTGAATFAGISLGIGVVSYCNPVPKILPEDASFRVCMITAGVLLTAAAGAGGFAGYALANKWIEKQKENEKEEPKKA